MQRRLLAALAVVSLCSATAANAGTYYWEFTFAPEAAGATGSGSATASLDDTTNVFSYSATFAGLSGDSTVAHFHCCTAAAGTGAAGVAVNVPSLDGFPAGVRAGSFSGSYDLDFASSFRAAFVTASGGTVDLARAAFIAGLNAGRAYLNIHSEAFPGGEIRGFAVRVPEPGTLALLGLGLAGLGLTRRRKPR